MTLDGLNFLASQLRKPGFYVQPKEPFFRGTESEIPDTFTAKSSGATEKPASFAAQIGPLAQQATNIFTALIRAAGQQEQQLPPGVIRRETSHNNVREVGADGNITVTRDNKTVDTVSPQRLKDDLAKQTRAIETAVSGALTDGVIRFGGEAVSLPQLVSLFKTASSLFSTPHYGTVEKTYDLDSDCDVVPLDDSNVVSAEKSSDIVATDTSAAAPEGESLPAALAQFGITSDSKLSDVLATLKPLASQATDDQLGAFLREALGAEPTGEVSYTSHGGPLT